MNLLLSGFIRLPSSLRQAVSRAYLAKHVRSEQLPTESWLSDYLQCLLVLRGRCLYIDGDEALSEWEYHPGQHPRTLQAYTRVGNSSDLMVMKQVWNHGEYQAVVDYMSPYLPAADVRHVIDAGANVGYTSLFLGSTFSQAQVVSIEPEPSNYRQLSRNVAASRLTNVETLNAGLWQRRAHLQVGRDFRDQREWSFYVQEVAQPTGLVGHSVRELTAERGWEFIDLLKIDIEGAERYLVETDELAAELLERARFVAIEIHDEFAIRPRIYDRLRHHSFEFIEHGELTIGRNTRLTSAR